MPSKERLFNAKVEEFLELKRSQRRSPQTIKDYRWLLLKTTRTMKEGGRELNPKRWTRDDVNWIRDHAYAHLELGVARRQFSILSDFAAFCGNTVIKDMKLEWPKDRRIHVVWLTPQEAVQVMELTEGIERIIIHLQLCLGLRRVEVLRMKVSDISLGYVNILGKGRLGGKRRTSPFHRDTAAELSYYHRIREEEIAKARRKNPNVVVPGALFIYEQKGQLHAYKKTALDKMLTKLGEQVGFKFSNHDLSRTFGRMMYRAGVKIEEIARIFGHADTRTTIQYIGLDFDDMSDAMRIYAQYQKMSFEPQMVQNEMSQIKSGQSGICSR